MKLERENSIYSLKNNKIENYFGIKIQELTFAKKINLRIDTNNNSLATCSKILNIMLPTKPNTYTKKDYLKVIWLGPDEWLIINSEDNLFLKLKDKLGDIEASVTDISENRTIIRISGEKIFTLLSKFLVLDLEKNLGSVSSCAQTLFVKVPILLVRNYKKQQMTEIDILVNRSHANYIYSLLVDGTNNLDF